MILLLSAGASSPGQVITPFTSVYSSNTKGNIAIIGNTLMTCPAGGTCATAQAGGAAQNNSYNMVQVDIDGNGATANSSSANFTLPSGATVLWAGLFWGASSNNAARNTASFSTPTSGGYSTVTGTVSASGNYYQSYAVVTAQVVAGGSGTYTLGGIRLTTGTGWYAGWALVIVYQDNTQQLRNLNVFRGFALVDATTPAVSMTITGFVAPQTGPVVTTLGVVAYEGDKSSGGDQFQGDQFVLNTTALSNTLNPVNDFFNSTISYLNTTVTTKNPNYVNQLGFDIDIVDASGIIPNGATSATVNLTTGGETYLPGAVTTAIDLYSPDIQATKTATDVNGGVAEPGDTLEYAVSVVNNGQDGAINTILLDTIPANTTYVPNSLAISAGANAGAKTDASGDDQAQYDNASNRVVFRLGTGANASSGGTLLPAASTAVKFRVKISPSISNGVQIINRAAVTFNAQTLGTAVATSSAPVTAVTALPADLQMSKTASASNIFVGQNVTFTLTVKNGGPKTSTNVLVSDTLPSGLTYVSSTGTKGSYNSSTGIWTVGTLANGDSGKLTLVATMATGGAKTNTARAVGPDITDTLLANNTASVTVTGVIAPDFSNSKKTFVDLNGGLPLPGDTLAFTIKVKNTGSTGATSVAVADTLPAGETVVAGSVTGGGTLAGRVITYPPFNLALNDSVSFLYRVTIDTAVVDSVSLTNTVRISANSVTQLIASTVIPRNRPVMVFSKISSVPSPRPGDTLTYTITYTNTGTGKASQVVVTDSIPLRTTYIPQSVTLNAVAKTDAVDGDEVKVVGTLITINIGQVQLGQSGTIKYKVRIN